MKPAVTQALVIIALSAFLGGVLNLIRADRMPWISHKMVYHVPERGNSDSLLAISESPYPKEIALDEVDSLSKNGAVIIDARLPEFYRDGHIPEAMNIPFEDLRPYLEALFAIPKDTVIIVYCDGGECELSYDLAVYMIQRGYSNLFEFRGGWEDWLASGRPAATGRGQ
ncbi:hypothetical protein AMJ86_04965 [bacterium SM23_57]|nr:MAG: hypothetical protein AMJ86_04965 [bacterium SM23_57]